MITATATAETLKMKDLSFGLHKILVKGYENSEITSLMIDNFYNELSKKYKDSLNSFSFIDGEFSFEIKLSNHFDDVEQFIRYIFCNSIRQLFINPYLFSILANYDYSNILQEIIASSSIEYIINNCITILNLSTDQNSMIIKVNLHN